MPRFLITGLPGTGKTHFGNWMQDKLGYFHLDMEDGFRRLLDLYAAWQRGMERDDFTIFAGLLAQLGDKLVMTWGFPPHAIHLATRVVDSGISPWWFDGDRDAARQAWLSREGHSDAMYFDYQCQQIDERRSILDEFFGANTIRVLEHDGSRLPERTIADRILADEPA